MMTTAPGSSFRMACRHSMPSWPLTVSRVKFMSSRTRSGRKSVMACTRRSGERMVFTFSAFGRSRRFRARSTSSLSSMMSIFPKSAMSVVVVGGKSKHTPPDFQGFLFHFVKTSKPPPQESRGRGRGGGRVEIRDSRASGAVRCVSGRGRLPFRLPAGEGASAPGGRERVGFLGKGHAK